MEQLLKKNFWGIVVILLVIANVATLAGIWYLKANRDRGITQQLNTANFIIKQVGFDTRQQLVYHQLVEEHRAHVGAIQSELKNAKDALFNSISDPGFSPGELDSLSSVIGNCEKRLDMLTYQHFKQVRALCKDQQKNKFDNIIKQVMRMMGPQGRRPPGPPPHQNGQRPPPPLDGPGPPPQ
jgi:protein CpxP